MDAQEALRLLADAAERFVNKAPNQKRLNAERAALLDALMHAQLLLSIKTPRLSQRPEPAAPTARAKRRPLRLAK